MKGIDAPHLHITSMSSLGVSAFKSKWACSEYIRKPLEKYEVEQTVENFLLLTYTHGALHTLPFCSVHFLDVKG